MSEQNIKLVGSFFDDVWNKGQLAIADELLAENFCDSGDKKMFTGGREGFKQFVQEILENFSEVTFEVSNFLPAGDSVSTSYVFRAAHKKAGKYMGVSAPVRQIKIEGNYMFRISENRLVEQVTDFNARKILAGLTEPDLLSKAIEITSQLAIPALFLVVYVTALLQNWVVGLPVTPQQWAQIIVGLGIVAVFILILYLRRNPQVAWVTNFLTLVIISTLITIVASISSPVIRIAVLKYGAVLFLSLLPGWLYLQFIIVRGKTLKDEFILNLFRLHVDDYGHLPRPPEDSLFYTDWVQGKSKAQADNLYLQKFEGAYGLTEGIRENILPVIFTTIVLSVGWAAIIQPEPILNFLQQLVPLVSLSRIPMLPAAAIGFGFLGAYFFILQMLVRRYFQDDLKTSAYVNAIVRIISVVLIIAAVDLVWARSESELQAFAFLIGIFPQIGLQTIQNLIAIPLGLVLKSLHKAYPLSDLDGLNIWYESRLLEEGIEDIQNLATANLVDVMLRTRVPVDRLVDWVDQAHLLLRLPREDDQRRNIRRWFSRRSEDESRVTSARARLRSLGIRTATDFIQAFETDGLEKCDAEGLDTQDGGANKMSALSIAAKVEDILLGPVAKEGDRDDTGLTRTFLKTLADEPNIFHIREWKSFPDRLKTNEQDTPGNRQVNDV